VTAAPLLKVLKINLEISKGVNSGQSHTFEKASITMGRGPENDLIFAQDSKISRQHLELVVSMNQVVVRNLSQKNPISVDGEVVSEKAVRPGSVVRFGDSEFKIKFDTPLESKPLLAPVPMSPPKSDSQTSSMPPAPTMVPTANANSFLQPKASNVGAPSASVPGAPGNWSAPTSANAAQTTPPVYRPSSGGNSKIMIYVIVALVLGGAYWFSQESAKRRSEVKLRDSVTTEAAISESQNEYEKQLQEIEKKGHDTIQFRLAQEQYLRGFRDYRQGQFMRAMEAFQAALSFYPAHELARKYYTLSKRKFDEQVQFNMIQGKRYYGVKNYRLCMGFYSNVIKMKKDERDPIRREALQYYHECEIKMRGKF